MVRSLAHTVSRASMSSESSISSYASSYASSQVATSTQSLHAAHAALAVDPLILKRISASVTHFHGPRKNLSYIISVEALGPHTNSARPSTSNAHFTDTSSSTTSSFSSASHLHAGARESSQCVARSFDEFRRLRKTLLLRVGSGRRSKEGKLRFGRHSAQPADAMRCTCQSRQGRDECAFDVTRTFLERLRFTRKPFFGLGASEQDVSNRQMEMNNFLRVLFAILHRMHPSTWHSNCLFVQDLIAFLDVEQSFLDRVEEGLKLKRRQLSLKGWKSYTEKTYGSGIRTQV